ncbi:hypothetical protein [Mucilaginibacter sp. FT3.2]|uniref:hypothetical protein n=1 Tax=Mucilaginibacter sp. FT3.2 TaxID=2723090 RepID=UPI001610D694|nr:hypothetical protein [Mucilaginibacter sp. FT3.2]MBB6231234.1 hypothetical protein [Mucilaginibacter sp. FT3.2]
MVKLFLSSNCRTQYGNSFYFENKYKQPDNRFSPYPFQLYNYQPNCATITPAGTGNVLDG